MERAFNYFKQFLLSSSWVRHGTFWFFMLLIGLIAPARHLTDHNVLKLIFIGIFSVQLLLFYTSYGLYALSKRWDSITIFAIGVLVGPPLFISWLESVLWHWYYPNSTISILYLYPLNIFFTLFVATLKFGKDMYVWQQQEFQRRQQHAETELNFLKAQISPHFLFNTLNNLYGHAVTKSDLLPDMMVRLSDLLRYTIYETGKPLVPLHDELDYIRNYIALEKIRLSENSNVRFTIQEDIDMGLQIAPLILISFIENSFKHSRHTVINQLYIRGEVTVQGSKLIMTIENSYNPDMKETSLLKREGGIGLEIVHKRLQMLYHERYQLHAEEADGIYKLKVQIDL